MENIPCGKLYPLTLPQQSIYYDYLLYRNESKYNMGGALVLNGYLNIDLFKRAYEYVASKYDIYRQRFVIQDGELFQTFITDSKVEVTYLDYRNMDNPLEDALRFIVEENIKPFPFEETSTCKETIVQVEDKCFIWFPRFHHLSNDGYGRSVINQAISESYNQLLKDGSFPEIKSFQYIDFLKDDLKYRESEAYKQSILFWREKLSPLPEPLGFTNLKHQIKGGSLHTQRVTLNLHRICYASILKIANDSGVSPFQTILGILFTTLCKLYNTNDIVIGMPVLNRSNHRFRNTPGHFMNMIPVRLTLLEDWAFVDVLNAIKAEVKESYRHQRLPLSETIRHFRNNPEFKNELFDVTVIYRKMDFNHQFGEARIHTITLDTQVRTESLSLEIDEYDDEGNVNLFFNYNPQVFAEREIMQLAKCFETVLFELIHSFEKSISQIKLLTAFEEHQIVNVLNENGEAKRTKNTIIDALNSSSAVFQNNTALLHKQLTISYKELSRKSNQIANVLIDQFQIEKGDIVCMAANRSTEAIIAMLGIMKTGAVFLPVDGLLPIERIRFILSNSNAKLLISDNLEYSKLVDRFVYLDELEVSEKSDVTVEIQQSDLAYIIYTSGSTGTPKGVMIEHGSFMNMFVNMIDVFGVKNTDRVLQFASLGFDAAIFEIFQALLTGATLVIADKETVQDPRAFVKYMDENKVSIATIPPAYLSALDKPELPFLHTLITAGEQAILSDVNHYKKYKKYINAYGPTEASVCASYFIVENDKEYVDYLPIGKTVAGSSLYVLNEKQELLPTGFVGELCISGPSLARGYLNNEELTAAKFVPNPFNDKLKMYRTGDKVKMLPDGSILFISRLDNQVKIKGNRIELGEIEICLQKHEYVNEVVVLDVDFAGDKALASFVVSLQEIRFSELKTFLRNYLPEYMIPQFFIFIDTIPLTQNGKINKNELRKLVSIKSVPKSDISIEPTELEFKLIPIFEKVLNYSPIGINDNFFELGGESLKTARLITRIQKELHLEINFQDVFNNPTVRGVATILMHCGVNLSEEIEKAPEQMFYPLSHAQKRLWILSQDKDNAAVYNMPVSLSLEGILIPEYLIKGIQIIVERHESLRTIFVEVDGTPCQKVLSAYPSVVCEHDFSRDTNADTLAQAFLNKEIMTAFDLSHQIPFCAHLVKISPEKHHLLLLIHHIAGDGMSIEILMNELSELYNSFQIGNTEKRLALLPIQYKDYCVYEAKLLETNKFQNEKEYWLKTLGGDLPVLQLPADRSRPAIKTYSGTYLFGEIDKSLSQQIKKFGRDKNISSFMILLASINVLFHKYTSSSDIIIGSPVAGRNHPDLEKQIGLFLNTVAIRNSISDSQSFLQFLKEVKENSTLAISNSNYPFDSLIQELNLERDISRSPLFDVLMQFQTKDVTAVNLNGISASFNKVDYTANKFDLIFTFTENDEKIDFNIGYNTRLFNRDRIERMSGHMLNILSNALSRPKDLIKDIPILDRTEMMLIRKFSMGKTIPLREITVVDAFEEQVINTPNRIALTYNDIQLSYRELDAQSNAIANEIRRNRTVRSNELIAIFASHSHQMVLGILGILKAGAAYLPISPDLPSERIKFMLADGDCKWILTEHSLSKAAQEFAENDIRILEIDTIKATSCERLDSVALSSSLAYVIYTSGSTGTPKGVMIDHRNLYNLTIGLADAVYQNTTDPLNIALISPFFFDASIKQIFYVLANGHCLNVVPDEIRMNGRRLLAFYQQHQIDVSDGTPVHLDFILDELVPGERTYLPKRFVIGGEQLKRQVVAKLFDLAGDEKPIVSNVYGPTECCDVSTCFHITSDSIFVNETDFSALPIGKPLPNVHVFILDENRNLAPLGVDGELYIAGEGLACGYLNKKQLSDEKFIEVDFDSPKRIYKTGDIGRYLDDGTILLSGRTDDQIKLRGFRIELVEIENCIRNFEAINACVVVLIGEPGKQEIAVYYTSTQKIEEDDLRHYLSLHLPEYMIPSFFIEIEHIPFTANGKVDKKLLPQPDRRLLNENDFATTGDILETKLIDIWKDLLGVEHVGLHDNFFKLGGHSLIAIRLVSRIHKTFNIEINIWEVFQFATVASLAKLLKDKNPSLFCPIEKAESKEYYPLSNAQRRMWLLSKLEGQSAMYNLPAAIMLKGNLDTKKFELAFQSIIQRHESLRTYFVEIEGEPFQKIVERFDFRIEYIEYAGEQWDKEQINAIAVAYSQQEFDLSALPLMRIKLIGIAPDKYLFLFNMHHIIGDGWSLDIMLKELIAFYNAYQNKTEHILQPLSIQYKEYAIWQNKLLKEASLKNVKEYWHNKLKGPRPVLDLPTDYNRPEIYSLEGNLLHFPLGKERTKALTELGGSRNSSLFMTLLASVYILLYKYTGEEDILLGSPVAGRPHHDLENQIGFFINTLVLRNFVKPENTFLEVLASVHDGLTEAFDNQIYPFDRLVDELDVERLRSRNPLFDVMVAWMVKNGMEMKFRFNEIEAEGIEFNITKSMFDLTFLFEESENEVILSLEYNTSLFKQDRIERMAEHFKQLVDCVLAAPTTVITDLSIVAKEEKNKLLFDFNNTTELFNIEKNTIDLFGVQLLIHPDNIALVFEDRHVSYSELDSLSNQIANSLIETIDLQEEDIIAVILKDPIFSVAAVLGIFKTGAAYLPILSSTPAERISFMMCDSQPKIVLVDGYVPEYECGKEIYLDVRTNLSANKAFSIRKIKSERLAYVIYTSGTTGNPKGVMIEHASLKNLIHSINRTVYSRYTEPLKELMVSSFAFDVSVKQVFASLCNGNTLHILNEDKRLDPREIMKYMIENKINIADLTPSVFSIMLEEGFIETRKPDIKELFLGSEALPYKLVQKFYKVQANKRIRLTNFYGPTECCVESSYYTFDPNSMNDDVDIALIGKPCSNQQIYVLDKHLNLCATGVPGEICIAGKGLARKYLNDSEKTKEKFVDFPLIAGTRIYRTGDLGRIRTDGNIQFLGRMDDQVKIRGFRVELQEIEKQLRDMVEINDCAVALFEKEGSSELVAYYTTDQSIDTNILRNNLLRFLPKYMIPSCFVLVEKIPLSANGKVDKKQLPEPNDFQNEKTIREAKDEIELSVIRICSEILKKERICLDDNFFEIGGNSLSAVRIISRIQKELDVNMALKDIFYNPVLFDISIAIKNARNGSVLKSEIDIAWEENVPASDDELKLLSELQFDDDEE